MSAKANNDYELTKGSRIAKNVLWNLAGGVLPLIVGLIAIPAVVKGLGIDRFGILTLVWMLIGYFSLFDFGLGRALTKIVAEKLGKHESKDIPSLVSTAVSTVVVFGVTGGVLITLLTPWFTQSILKIPISLGKEALYSFYILAISIPFVIASTGLRGILEAYQRFDLLNYVRIPVGVAIFLSPLLSLLFSSALPLAVAILASVRVIEFLIYVIFCLRVVGKKGRELSFSKKWLKPLFGFGLWMTITNVIGPLMIYLDRLFVGALISITAVAFYSAPFEIVTRLLIIPTAVVGVLFPAISSLVAKDRGRALQVFTSANKFIFIALFPISLVLISFPQEILNYWLSKSFAENSSFVLRFLAIGVFINSLAQSAFAVVQGAGRPDWTAKLHLMELPTYIIMLWLLLKHLGIDGAAIAWVMRVLIDTIALYVMAGRLIPNMYPSSLMLLMYTSISITCITCIIFIEDLTLRITISAAILVIFMTLAWFKILQSNERVLVRKMFRSKIYNCNINEKIPQ